MPPQVHPHHLPLALLVVLAIATAVLRLRRVPDAEHLVLDVIEVRIPDLLELLAAELLATLEAGVRAESVAEISHTTACAAVTVRLEDTRNPLLELLFDSCHCLPRCWGFLIA